MAIWSLGSVCCLSYVFSDIRYEVQHIPSLTLVWVAADSLPSCPCEQIQTMFWCCLLCSGKTTINQTDRVVRPRMVDRLNLFLQRWSSRISTWAVVNKKKQKKWFCNCFIHLVSVCLAKVRKHCVIPFSTFTHTEHKKPILILWP